MRRLLLWIVASVVGLVLLAIIGLGVYTNTAHVGTNPTLGNGAASDQR